MKHILTVLLDKVNTPKDDGWESSPLSTVVLNGPTENATRSLEQREGTRSLTDASKGEYKIHPLVISQDTCLNRQGTVCILSSFKLSASCLCNLIQLGAN